ncbi:MAG: hypothetical protein JXQ79_10175 [Rhodobacteraceae bacterium]|nr:hypothetical protein [Paracoccaceae bacterium]
MRPPNDPDLARAYIALHEAQDARAIITEAMFDAAQQVHKDGGRELAALVTRAYTNALQEGEE